ncbi:Aste57867_7136 [Aphanomyces stellatus]|uniref:Aste57867_7136 protein n=1 Tax=Aphanomyces stellatus TaxID=120398 RepID=A0A485KG48_9STRA|nr:hypothetical protein As57867_007112 [Aphanomyces stellatus]VFT84068.1 Aste57867_7136 [Aphanomyces stellatus]
MVTPGTSAFYGDVGTFTDDQAAGWVQVTRAVHANGGKIFNQLNHPGRAAHPDLNDGVINVAPSALGIQGETRLPSGIALHHLPHALSTHEIGSSGANFAAAAKHAVDVAGFDGVEIHGANGYLIEEFLCDASNHRTDGYGGSLVNRARFLKEVLATDTTVVDPSKVGIRFSPLNSYNSMKHADALDVSEYVAKIAQEFNVGYVHVMCADFFKFNKGTFCPSSANISRAL